jgi:hypothetical protein
MRDDETPRLEIPPPLGALFERVGAAFDALEAAGEPVALDLFFEEVEFEGEAPRLCLTVNDLVSTYHEDGAFTVVLTDVEDEAPYPWFRRPGPAAAATQIVQLLLDRAFLSPEDAALMNAALDRDD